MACIQAHLAFPHEFEGGCRIECAEDAALMKVEVSLPLMKDDGMQQCHFESNAQC